MTDAARRRATREIETLDAARLVRRRLQAKLYHANRRRRTAATNERRALQLGRVRGLAAALRLITNLVIRDGPRCDVDATTRDRAES